MTAKRLLPLVLSIVLGLGACAAVESGPSITVLAPRLMPTLRAVFGPPSPPTRRRNASRAMTAVTL